MHKKIILALVTFAVAAGAYFVLSSGDRRHRPRRDDDAADAVRNFVSLPATQPSHSISEAGMTFSPGDQTLARVYDDVTGRLKYQFEAEAWEPVSETDFLLQDLLIQIFSPRGEITYISADRAQVTLARKAKNRLEPKRGWLRGNVNVVIDRTTSQWREENPELADRYAHPDDLIDIELEDARFDMDQAELVSEGTILVDSREARIEDVEGLTLQWNQLDNRIDVLRFKHGGRMMLRRGGRLVDFAMPGGQRDARPSDRADVAAGDTREGAARFDVPRAQAMKPMSIDFVTADEAAAEIRLEGGLATANRPKSLASEPLAEGGTDRLRPPEVLAADVEALKAEARLGASANPTKLASLGLDDTQRRKRVHTYSAVFQNQVVVEQRSGLRTIGKLEADNLEINFDFGEKLRDMSRSPRGRQDRASPRAAKPEPATVPALDQDSETLFPLEEDRTKLILTWDGPLEMRALRVDPSEQTGQRFDAIATGQPVKVESEQGKARCGHLVYRHERGQVWLSGSESAPVEMSVSASRRLVGREVFFDQKRGLARVDGPGSMIDERGSADGGWPTADGDELLLAESSARGAGLLTQTADLVSSGREAAKRSQREPVEIHWSRGVDIELGHRTVKRKNPSTGLKEDKRREYLQRAWFHGDVSVQQGESRLAAEEVATTFGSPLSTEELADHIQHLNMSGEVRLSRDDDLITADRLDVEMVVTQDGRNVPEVVDGMGRVLVRQGESEFRAERMHVVLEPARRRDKAAASSGMSAFHESRTGIKSLDASGDVFVSDPEHNLKIRDAETLKCTMRDGNRLVRATIVSADPAAFAKARYGEVAIHGHRIEIDMDDESVDVPGPGKAWMITRKDFGGRKLRKPAPVRTTWTDRMQFRMAKDYGLFTGNVHSEVQSFSLDCDKLTVRFGKTPPLRESQGRSLVDRFWLLGSIIGDKAEVEAVEPRGPSPERRRPTYVVAEGNAVALSTDYATGSRADEPGRLLSLVRVAGDRIVADLLREQMSVPCAGTLLILDYQFDPDGGKARLARNAIERDPLMSAVRSEGPSQSYVKWRNSMDFFVDRGLIAFDKDVEMVHCSGREMVLKEELARARDTDPDTLRQLPAGRKATLTCGYLLLEFLIGDDQGSESDPATPVVRATDLRRLIAKHVVHLQDGTKSLMGEHLQYLHDADEIQLEGSDRLEARIIDQDETNQRFNMWRGPLLIWNRRTNQIEAPGARIRASRG
ncbi:MAG: hypothetical protein JXQ75_21690 [Phycisphaerae bacterium]|nr:hypothetical protein [Phycisphaerae bacterium]